MSTTKEQRLQIRVDPQRKQLLERAANAAHQSLSASCVVGAARLPSVPPGRSDGD
jgi:uncharacterized protein (DUF1778 family)